jgi:hypothetical protein
MDLESERVLQVVARLLVIQPGYGRSPLADIYYLHAFCFRQRAAAW